MTAVLQLVPPAADDAADPRSPEVYRGGLASARAALREGMSRRYRHPEPEPPDEHDDQHDDQHGGDERDHDA